MSSDVMKVVVFRCNEEEFDFIRKHSNGDATGMIRKLIQQRMAAQRMIDTLPETGCKVIKFPGQVENNGEQHQKQH